MFDWFNKIVETARFIGDKVDSAFRFIGEQVKPVVQTISNVAKTVSSVVRSSGLPYSGEFSNLVDGATNVADYLVGAYDKADNFKNNLASNYMYTKEKIKTTNGETTSSNSTSASNNNGRYTGLTESVAF